MNQIHIKPDRTTAVRRTHFERQKIGGILIFFEG